MLGDGGPAGGGLEDRRRGWRWRPADFLVPACDRTTLGLAAPAVSTPTAGRGPRTRAWTQRGSGFLAKASDRPQPRHVDDPGPGVEGRARGDDDRARLPGDGDPARRRTGRTAGA